MRGIGLTGKINHPACRGPLHPVAVCQAGGHTQDSLCAFLPPNRKRFKWSFPLEKHNSEEPGYWKKEVLLLLVKMECLSDSRKGHGHGDLLGNNLPSNVRPPSFCEPTPGIRVDPKRSPDGTKGGEGFSWSGHDVPVRFNMNLVHEKDSYHARPYLSRLQKHKTKSDILPRWTSMEQVHPMLHPDPYLQSEDGGVSTSLLRQLVGQVFWMGSAFTNAISPGEISPCLPGIKPKKRNSLRCWLWGRPFFKRGITLGITNQRIRTRINTQKSGGKASRKAIGSEIVRFPRKEKGRGDHLLAGH